jgi:hypothetical protein
MAAEEKFIMFTVSLVQVILLAMLMEHSIFIKLEASSVLRAM